MLVEGRGSSCCRWLSPLCRCLSPHFDHVSSPRSSDPRCGFPTLDSRSRSCLRSREKLPRPTCWRAQPWPSHSRPSGKCITFPDFTRCFRAQPTAQLAGRPPPVPPPPFLAAGRGSLRICMRRPLEFPNRNRRWLPAGTTVVGRLCPPLGCRALARCTTFQLCSNIPKWDDSVAKKAYGWAGTLQRNLRSIESKAASSSKSSLA